MQNRGQIVIERKQSNIGNSRVESGWFIRKSAK